MALADAKKEIVARETELKSRDAAISDLKKEMLSSKNAVAEQKNQLSGLQSELAKAGQANKAGEAERKQLEAKLIAERADVAKLQQQLSSLEKNREMIAAKAGMQAKTLAEREAALADAKKEMVARENEMNLRDVAISDLKKAVVGIAERIG